MGILLAKLFRAFPKPVAPRFQDFTTPVSTAVASRRRPLARPGAPLAKSPIDIVCKDDFDFAPGDGEPVDFAAVWAEKSDRLSPFALNDATREMYFVEVDAGVDLSKPGKGLPFYYQAQRRHATCVYAVPYAEVVRVASALREDLSGCVLLFSTGRCGSTLFSKVLDTYNSVQSLSEPDIYTQLVFVAGYAEGKRDAELQQLMRAYTELLVHAHRRCRPSAPRVCVKFRSMVTMQAPLLMRAMPDAKHAFLYRNAVDVVDSFCCGIISNAMGWPLKVARKLGCDYELAKYQGPFAGIGRFFSPLSEDPRFPQPAVQPLGVVGMIALGWLSVLDAAQRVQRQSRKFDAVFRYEDLVAQRAEVTRQVMAACGLQDALVNAASGAASGGGEGISKAFDEDAHKDSKLASSRRTAAGDVSPPQYITQREEALLQALLARHEGIKDGYFVLEGTLRP